MSETQMLINYVPGEECRVAIVEDGKLEELHVERFAHSIHVGNVYVGRVVNVEPAIQAAFVDFGEGENGFLHVTDLHPRYFPGEEDDATERVGFKTPRRERPPIQRALRRGDEIIVQVLKEGVGTKGPTVTSYLSIPGRFLVMMPGMDNVGVSRKVEDEDQRRAMREILDQLDLPEGFGFILRTAGMDRTKLELKRDLAYLQRLWKDMERRRNNVGKSRLLYSESDLLVRALRDLLGPEINQVVIDSEVALKRASRFMKIVSPRGQARLLRFPGTTPLFHAFGIEQQITLIHAREVPLPSGGRLVIDQTEALVAIDVNSGRSRESRDSESNAYNTNVEAVDEICRQLRLRDMGGIVICDLIDMRAHDHRKDIEHRFKERLKRDRAKSTVLPISEFGILELTRQRMRPSHESVHFTDCPVCRGRGMLQKPDSVAADALRELSAMLDWDKAAKVEMVVAPRIAGDLLSAKRQLLGRIERTYGKHVDVRVSEQVALDRVTFYAYDAQGADLDLNTLPRPHKPRELVAWEEPAAPGDESAWALDAQEEQSLAAQAAETPAEASEDPEPHPIELEPTGDAGPDEPLDGGMFATGGRHRRGRRGGRGRGRDGLQQPQQRQAQRPQQPRSTPLQNAPEPLAGESHLAMSAEGEPTGEPADGALPPPHNEQGQPGEGGRRRRRRRRRGGRGRAGPGADGGPVGGGPVGVPTGEPQPHELSGEQSDSPMVGEMMSERPSPSDAAGAESHDDTPHDQMHAEQGPADHAQPGEGQAGGRRRRRRRRGRGGRGGGQGGQAQPPHDGQPHHDNQQRQPQQQSGYTRGPRTQPRERGDQRPRDQSRQQQQRPQQPPQPAPPQLQQQQPPKPRTLYGARRKLNPSELNRRPKPE